MTYKEERTPDLRDLVALLRGRWKLIAACGLAGALLAVLVGANMSPRYTAKAQLLVTRSDAGPAGAFDEAVVDTHVELILSPSHLREVQKSLADDPPDSRLGAPPQSPLSIRAKGAWEKLRETSGSILPFSGADEQPAPQSTQDVDGNNASQEHQPIDFEWLRENLNVFKEQRSRVIAVTFTSDDPKTAAIIANRVAEIYVKRGRDDQLARRERLKKELAERIPAARAGLEETEAAVRYHRLASGLLDQKSIETMDHQIAELRRQLAIDLAKLGEKENVRLAPMRNRQDDQGDQKQHIEKIFGGYRTASTFRLGTEPEIGADDAGRREGLLSREQSSRLVDETVANPPSDRNALQERLHRTLQRLESLEQSRKSLREAETKLRELEREASASTQLYESLLKRQTELFAQDPVQQEAHIVSAALPPEFPSSPSPVLFVLPAFVAFAIGGGLALVVMDRFDSRVRSERDVEGSIGVPCIGLVPRRRRFKLGRARHDLIDNPFNIYGEALRSVVATALSRRRVAVRKRDLRDCAVFAITSSERGEGKTTLAVSFAVSAGALGQRVLLIDLDFRNPGIADALGSLEKDGTTHTRGADAAERAVEKNAELGIDCLPLADRREHAFSFLSTNQLLNIINKYKDHYDCIVIDSPPLLNATETRAIVSAADNVIFVLKWGVTDIDIAGRALRQLQHAGIKDIQRRVFGVVTQVNPRKHRFYR